MDSITFEQVPDLFDQVGACFIEKKEELCEMDAAMGDGDLGLTMSKGYGALPDILRQEGPAAGRDIGKLLMKGSMKMTSLIPSTMGFLMSTGLMEAGKKLKGVDEIGPVELAAFLEGFAEGIAKRGKCTAGQRTIYDAIAPAANAAKHSADSHADLQHVIAKALDAASDGVEATKAMVPVFGKAAVHASKASGVADQGAVAGYYLIQAIHDFICD